MTEDDARLKAIALWFASLQTGDEDLDWTAEEVAGWTFSLPAEAQWPLVLAMVRLAPDDHALSHVACGPLEGLLGGHGEAFIGRVEAEAARDPWFARTLTGVWQHGMSDEVFARVRAIQDRVPDPLNPTPADPSQVEAMKRRIGRMAESMRDMLPELEAQGDADPETVADIERFLDDPTRPPKPPRPPGFGPSLN